MPNLGSTEKLIFTITSGGAGVIGQAPSVVIQKQSNGYFFNGAGYTPTYVALNMTEESSANFPGRYFYSFNQALDNNITNAAETYSIRYVNTGTYALVVDEELNFGAPLTVSYTAQAQPGIEFVRPGFQNPEQTYIVLNGNEKRLKATFVSSLGIYYDPYELTLQIYDYGKNLVIAETILPPLVGTYVKRDSAGNYYVDYTPIIAGDYDIVWSYRDQSGGERFYASSYLYSIPIHVNSLFPLLKNQIDKAQKELGIFGYLDSNLYLYLKGGLSEINRVPPTTALTFVTFPTDVYSQLLIDVSTFVALQSQGLCAIDTDVQNYSLQGNSMNIDHWTRISAYLAMMQASINKALWSYKLAYSYKGTVRVERSANFRSQALFSSSPSGLNFGSTLGTR